MTCYLSPQEIRAAQPEVRTSDPIGQARERMQATGQWHPNQALGRRYGVGCVALEITQRCNLDCTLCYLSESSEALRDIPLAEVFRRIDMIRAHYGPGTDVQVTGGDPTLRDRAELVAIVKRIRELGMRSSLFTNGIKATRDLLTELAQAGLTDVAFHVDLTQQRAGFATEAALNAVRREYIDRARGLPLHVVFNTTVFSDNIAEIPALVRFFVEHADVVQFASFQLQAETGRGVLGAREALAVTPDNIARLINEGAGTPVTFGSIQAGHSACNRYASTLVVNGRVYDVLADTGFVGRLLESMTGVRFDRHDRKRVVESIMRWMRDEPRRALECLPWAARTLWPMRRDLVAARGKVGKLSFFIHNFMDACSLERDRIEACSFMVATAEGPISMCVHNAKRDDFLLKPLPMQEGARIRFWNPVTGRLQDDKPDRVVVNLTRKTARGRAKPAIPNSTTITERVVDA
jgi:7,8-dihydro-6-hydroxymethylpterin dimethyltransferase